MSWAKTEYDRENKTYILNPGDLVFFDGGTPFTDDNVLSLKQWPVVIEQNQIGLFIDFIRIKKRQYAKVLLKDKIYLINPHFLKTFKNKL